MSRLTRDPFHFPCNHAPKLLIHLGEVSPVRCGRFEFDARLAIVERSFRYTVGCVARVRHPVFVRRLWRRVSALSNSPIDESDRKLVGPLVANFSEPGLSSTRLHYASCSYATRGYGNTTYQASKALRPVERPPNNFDAPLRSCSWFYPQGHLI